MGDVTLPNSSGSLTTYLKTPPMLKPLSNSTNGGGVPLQESRLMPDECCRYDVIIISKIMEPAYANAGSCRQTKLQKPMECADKPSWNGDGRVCFPPIGPMIVEWWCSRHPMS